MTNPAHLPGLSHLDNFAWTRKLSFIYWGFAKTHANPDTDGNSIKPPGRYSAFGDRFYPKVIPIEHTITLLYFKTKSSGQFCHDAICYPSTGTLQKRIPQTTCPDIYILDH
jgi:hypothetical protein